MAISASNLSLVRIEYGDTAETVFTDPEIETIWDLMAGADTEYEQRRATIGQMFLITLNSATKLHDYTQGESQEKESQIYKHLRDRYSAYEPSINAAIGTQSEIARSTLRPRKHQDRDYPYDDPRYRLRNNRVLGD